MTTDIRWTVPSDGHTFPIYGGPVEDMDRIAEFSDERGVQNIHFGGDTWVLTADKGPVAEARTSTSTFTATGNADTFGRSTTVECVADRHKVTIIAENRTEFILEIDGEKAGQFTSANRGMKNLHLQFEGPGVTLPLDVQIFLSWVARRCMETRMLNATWMWTLTLLIAIPVIIFLFLFP